MRKDVKTGLFIGIGIVFVGWVLFALYSDTLQERRQKQLANETPVPKPAEPFTPPAKPPVEIPPEPTPPIEEPVKPAPVKKNEQIHTVETGQTLSAISTLYYGTPAQWKVILDANSDILKNDPTRLRPGMQLKIPKKP